MFTLRCAGVGSGGWGVGARTDAIAKSSFNPEVAAEHSGDPGPVAVAPAAPPMPPPPPPPIGVVPSSPVSARGAGQALPSPRGAPGLHPPATPLTPRAASQVDAAAVATMRGMFPYAYASHTTPEDECRRNDEIELLVKVRRGANTTTCAAPVSPCLFLGGSARASCSCVRRCERVFQDPA